MSTNRETWLNELAALMAPRFESLGHPLPPFRVSLGFTSHGSSSRALAECWSNTASEDGRFEIFIAPGTSDSLDIAVSLAHELAHAADGLKSGHKGTFGAIVTGLGLLRPWTSTPPGPDFRAWVQPMIDRLGAIPHGRIGFSTNQAVGKKAGVKKIAGGVTVQAPEADGGSVQPAESSRAPKQSTRLLKVDCAECGYTVRVTAKWLEKGPPGCPEHGPMQAAA